MKNALVHGKYDVKDLVDIEKLERVFSRFSEATGYTTGFLAYPSLEILIATGWRDICTKFHRGSEASVQVCKRSNKLLLDSLQTVRELSIEKCEHGLVDGATPVIIEGSYIACVSTGQVFFEEPDMDWYEKHGRKMGYDIDEYLKAVKMVPIVAEKKFKENLIFLSEIAVIIGEMGLQALLDEEEKIFRIKKLEGLVPMCASCKKMLPQGKDPRKQESWLNLEQYITERSTAEFTHGLCPVCMEKTKENICIMKNKRRSNAVRSKFRPEIIY